jgi:hypothetical protein
VPLSSLTEFGEGWVLFFWTLKMVGFVSAFAVFVSLGAWHDMDKRQGGPGARETTGIVNWFLSRLSSAECIEHVMVCKDKDCGKLANHHLCPKPHPIDSLSCICVVGLFAMLIINMRWTHSQTSDYVKNLESKNGLNTEHYSLMVENPPEDAVDPDEWHDFFSQFGDVAYVTVAKDDGDLLWKCLEPRLLMLQLYRDNPTALRDRISVRTEDIIGPKIRRSSMMSSTVVSDDVVFKKVSEESHGAELDAGDADAQGSQDDSLVAMAPWYTGGHLVMTPDIMTVAEQLERTNVEPTKALKLTKMKDPFAKYGNPYIFWRWMVFELKQSFPYFFGTLSQKDRDMLSEHLFTQCPKNLKDELKKLEDGFRYKAVRIFVVFETIKSRRQCLDALTVGGILRTFFDSNREDIPKHFKFRGMKTLVVTEPPAPEQMNFWQLKVGWFQRAKDEVFSVFVTSILILIAYAVALWSSMSAEHEESKNTPQYLRGFLFAVWAQVRPKTPSLSTIHNATNDPSLHQTH